VWFGMYYNLPVSHTQHTHTHYLHTQYRLADHLIGVQEPFYITNLASPARKSHTHTHWHSFACSHLLSGTPGTSNTVHVVVNVLGQVVVNDVRDVGDIQATGSHIGGHHHRGAPSLEGAQRLCMRLCVCVCVCIPLRACSSDNDRAEVSVTTKGQLNAECNTAAKVETGKLPKQ